MLEVTLTKDIVIQPEIKMYKDEKLEIKTFTIENIDDDIIFYCQTPFASGVVRYSDLSDSLKKDVDNILESIKKISLYVLER